MLLHDLPYIQYDSLIAYSFLFLLITTITRLLFPPKQIWLRLIEYEEFSDFRRLLLALLHFSSRHDTLCILMSLLPRLPLGNYRIMVFKYSIKYSGRSWRSIILGLSVCYVLGNYRNSIPTILFGFNCPWAIGHICSIYHYRNCIEISDCHSTAIYSVW